MKIRKYQPNRRNQKGPPESEKSSWVRGSHSSEVLFSGGRQGGVSGRLSRSIIMSLTCPLTHTLPLILMSSLSSCQLLSFLPFSLSIYLSFSFFSSFISLSYTPPFLPHLWGRVWWIDQVKGIKKGTYDNEYRTCPVSFVQFFITKGSWKHLKFSVSFFSLSGRSRIRVHCWASSSIEASLRYVLKLGTIRFMCVLTVSSIRLCSFFAFAL